MKILILAPYYNQLFSDHIKTLGGVEMMVTKQLPILSKYYEVCVAYCGQLDPYYEQYGTFHKVTDETRENLSESIDKRTWSRSLKKKYEKIAHVVNPDIVISHLHGTGPAKSLSRYFPVVHQIHTIFDAPMLLKNHYPSYLEIIKNGGRIYCSPQTERETKKNLIKNNIYTGQEFVTDHSISYTVFDDEFYQHHVLPTKNYSFMAGRIEEKYIDKNFHKIDSSGAKTKMFIVGQHKKILEQLEQSTNTELYHNRPRNELIRELRNSTCTIIANPLETASIVAMEGMMLGIPPISFVRKNGDKSGIQDYAEKCVTGLLPPISFDDSNWIEKLKLNISHYEQFTTNQRYDISSKTRNLFSEESWVTEINSLLESAKCKNKTEDLGLL